MHYDGIHFSSAMSKFGQSSTSKPVEKQFLTATVISFVQLVEPQKSIPY